MQCDIKPARLAATALVSSYRKARQPVRVAGHDKLSSMSRSQQAVELLRKRQMSDQVVQAAALSHVAIVQI